LQVSAEEAIKTEARQAARQAVKKEKTAQGEKVAKEISKTDAKSDLIQEGTKKVEQKLVEEAAKRVEVVEQLTKLVAESKTKLNEFIASKNIQALKDIGLSDKQIEALLGGGKTSAAEFGNAIEKMVQQGAQKTPVLAESLEYAATKTGNVAGSG